MNLNAVVRRAAILLVVAAVVAGCASPQESGPEDRHADGDRDGIPDGNSPVPGANEPDNSTMQNSTAASGNATNVSS